MPNFFKSFFSGKSETPESEKQKNDQKNFEIFKYDGLRAQRMGRPDYAVKCFTEALAIQEEFETMGYLSQLYIQMGETAKARELLEKMAAMEPHLTSTFLTLANVCFIQEDYQAINESPSDYVQSLVVRTFCPLPSTTQSKIDVPTEVANYNSYLQFYKDSRMRSSRCQAPGGEAAGGEDVL